LELCTEHAEDMRLLLQKYGSLMNASRSLIPHQSLTLRILQALYATAVEDASTSSKSDNSLPELYTDSLDAEQIWLQLDMQLGGVLKRARRLMRKAGDIEQFINPDMEVALKGKRSDVTWLGHRPDSARESHLALPSEGQY